MRSFRHWPCLLLCTSLLAAWPLQAATVQASATQQMIDALAKANSSVVGVRVTAAEGARSAETLGQRRSGSVRDLGAAGAAAQGGLGGVEQQQGPAQLVPGVARRPGGQPLQEPH